MADVFSQEKRKQIMSNIRSKNSEAERIIFSYLRRQKIHFQKHYSHKKVGVNIDIARPRDKKAVFIDGDFWHGRNYEKTIKRLPDDGYWKQKITKNVERDQKSKRWLEDAGWEVIRVWESDIKRKSTRQAELDKIVTFLVPDKH